MFGLIYSIVAVMLNEMVKEIDAIYDLSGFTATLDIILSFAAVLEKLSITKFSVLFEEKNCYVFFPLNFLGERK